METSKSLDIRDHEHLLAMYNLPEMKKRSIMELHGICRAVVYDGCVSDQEINLIIDWLDQHQGMISEWPVSRLAALLCKILDDGVITRGGICYDRFKLSLGYMIVGELGQDTWKYGKYGNKIESCMNAIQQGKANTQIIRECHFVEAILKM